MRQRAENNDITHPPAAPSEWRKSGAGGDTVQEHKGEKTLRGLCEDPDVELFQFRNVLCKQTLVLAVLICKRCED